MKVIIRAFNGIFFSILSGFSLSTLGEDRVLYNAQEFVESKSFVLWIGLLCLIFLAEYILLYFENKTLKAAGNQDKSQLLEEIKEIKQKLETYSKPENVKYKRFEEIKKIGYINYGYITYEPFFADSGGQKAGIGHLALMEMVKVLGIDASNTHGHSASWDNIFTKLENKTYDVIATPLYETRSRLYDNQVIYCIPLFYSEIGLYVHEDDFKTNFNMVPMTYEGFIKDKESNWSSPYIKKEISEIISNKLEIISSEVVAKVDGNNAGAFEELLEQVNNRNTNVNIVAMEVFKADMLIKKNSYKLINLLKTQQIIYPVSFVVRKEDTVLRNFLNLRIIELYSKEKAKRTNQGKIRKNEERNLHDIIEDGIQGCGFSKKAADSIFIHEYEFDNLV